MRRPRIGISVDKVDGALQYKLHYPYVHAVLEAGGLPLLIPFHADGTLARQTVQTLDGLLLTGGDDPDPSLWGEAWHPCAVPMDGVRQRHELALIAAAEAVRLPVLGICLGMQLMNVHRGGSLIQFLPDHPRDNPLEHRFASEGPMRRHAVRLEPGSRLAEAIGSLAFSVHTGHKQAVGRLGRGMRAVGWAPDGVIEAIEDPALPLFAGVQWHAERLMDEAEHRRVLELLTQTAGAIAR